MSLISEIKQRNVVRAAVAYAVVCWLLVQVAELLLDAFEAPGWVFRALIILLATGFPIALALSWFFELTPSGLVRNEDLPPDSEQARAVRQYINPIIISMLTAAVILFAMDKFVWTGGALVEGPAADATVAAPRENSLAVLPFSNRSSVAEDAYFVDGIHDDLLTMLAKIDSLGVVSRTSVERYRGTELSIPEISRELGVSYVLEGGVQRAGNQVRINAQLIDAATDEHLWAETFDRELTTGNLFAIQSDIARAIANALDAKLSSAVRRQLEKVPTGSLDAYDAYLLGRQSLLEQSLGGYRDALAHFETAVKLDSEFAQAHAGMCTANLSLYLRTSEVEYFSAAEAACNRALAIDPERVEVHVALGSLFRHHGDYDLAEREHRLALETEPQNIDALIELGLTLAVRGDSRNAESFLQLAVTLQPDHWPGHYALFDFYRNYDDRPDRYERSLKAAMRVVELRPDSASAWNNLGTAYHGLQQYEAAKAAWDRALELEPTRTAYTNRGLQYYYDGDFAASARMQRKAIELAPNDHRAWGRLAESLRLQGGQAAQAREAYEKAIELADAQIRINPQDWNTRGLLGIYCVYADRGVEAAGHIQAALELSGRDAEALLYAALVANAQGDEDAALAALEEMVASNDAYRDYVADDPDLAALRDNPRFDRLLNP